LIAVWLFAFGATVGSFLNVVVYRLPTGMSLVEPGSHCPACKRRIRWFDNVPILSWIILRGRCRDCRSAIAMRYPIVEAITAVLFVLLGAVECLGGGENLPLRCAGPSDLVIAADRTVAELYAICAYHLLLLCTLWAAVLIEYDGHRLPVRLFLPAATGGALAPLVWPHLHPVPALVVFDGWMTGLADGTIGLAAGTILGLLASLVPGSREQRGMIFGPACVGLFLGWQAALVLVLASIVIAWLLWVAGRWLHGIRRIPAIAWLAIVALGWILLWAPLVARWPVLG